MLTQFLSTLAGGFLGTTLGGLIVAAWIMKRQVNETLEQTWRLETAEYGTSIHDD